MPYLCDACSDSAMPFTTTGGHTFQSKALFTTSFKKEGGGLIFKIMVMIMYLA